MKYLLSILFVLSAYCLPAQTVYKTPSGGKYHTATCRYVKNVSHGMSISEAKKLGLTACSQCHPDQSNQRGFVSSGSSKGLGIKAGEAQGANSRSVQCKGTTKKGTRCKHMTKNVNGYCHQHEPK
ncbi:DUF5763 domain-containing protein [Sphingobacterium cellulitidis]|uniref:DUF5763 domain-containing protein n=1 Tax=Sphingobacterium cellulitidis TaxID=1768011 RepID=UPI0015F7EE47|nr:DUF5763 domain-containing protein [Sphingobacterium soli]MBA8985916.1 hypothetical protein [Sphingobacterium soli]